MRAASPALIRRLSVVRVSPGSLFLITNTRRITCSMEESIKGYVFGTAVLQFRGLDMKNVEPGLMGLGRSDPFFECEFFFPRSSPSFPSCSVSVAMERPTIIST
jgi:hypothetical protein